MLGSKNRDRPSPRAPAKRTTSAPRPAYSEHNTCSKCTIWCNAPWSLARAITSRFCSISARARATSSVSRKRIGESPPISAISSPTSRARRALRSHSAAISPTRPSTNSAEALQRARGPCLVDVRARRIAHEGFGFDAERQRVGGAVADQVRVADETQRGAGQVGFACCAAPARRPPRPCAAPAGARRSTPRTASPACRTPPRRTPDRRSAGRASRTPS